MMFFVFILVNDHRCSDTIRARVEDNSFKYRYADGNITVNETLRQDIKHLLT